ncbi:MAG: DUF2845 domain-containing protein [Desulfohalobiaceae bacterium]
MPGRKTIPLFLIMVLTLPIFPPVAIDAADKNAWRVEGKLIRVGDSKGRVLALAGEPDSRETIQKAVDIGEGGIEKVEVWYYLNESKDKMHTIHFRNSKVSRIQWERY